MGRIALKDLREKSKVSAYEEIAQKNAIRLAQAFLKNLQVSVISNLISKAITFKRPKARYMERKYGQTCTYFGEINPRPHLRLDHSRITKIAIGYNEIGLSIIA